MCNIVTRYIVEFYIKIGFSFVFNAQSSQLTLSAQLNK